MDHDQRSAIAAIGQRLGPDVLATVQLLFAPEQAALAADHPPTLADAAYGEHPRQRLDLYAPTDATAPPPILLWVHGGGFVRGEKSSPDHPFNAHVGRWAARNGMVGAVMNYRLAPDATWPSGGEDVAAAVEWLRREAATHNGEPDRIVLVGTSAGAVHIATALHLYPDLPVAAAVLMSGFYGFTAIDERDSPYYGDAADYPGRAPRDAIVATTLPLMIACAEFDPARFQREMLGLLTARLARHGAIGRGYIASGHNHFSMACHLGGNDRRLSDEILGFVRDVCARGDTE